MKIRSLISIIVLCLLDERLASGTLNGWDSAILDGLGSFLEAGDEFVDI